MKQFILLLLLLLFTSKVYSQKYIGTNITFNNNRICFGLQIQSKKGFGFVVSGGILGKDEFSRTRVNLFGRIFRSKADYVFPFYDSHKECAYLQPNGYKVTLYGAKIQFQYSISNKQQNQKGNFYDIGIFLGIYLSKGYWQPIQPFDNTQLDTLSCINKKIITSVGGLFGGLFANYYFAIPKYHLLYIGIGIQTPFYKPLYPYSYAFDNSTASILSGLEPDFKLSLIKKL
jgi:hypothetical protein